MNVIVNLKEYPKCEKVEAIVHLWYCHYLRRILPLNKDSRWIKKQAGKAVFRELRRIAPLKSGDITVTSPGKLSCKAIIHVAITSFNSPKSEQFVKLAIQNIVSIANQNKYCSISIPVFGYHQKNTEQQALYKILEYLKQFEFAGRINVSCHWDTWVLYQRELQKNGGEIIAPWIAFPYTPSYSGGWRQGLGEYWINEFWFPFWNKLDDQAKKLYLEKWEANEDWREYLTEVYGRSLKT